MSNSSGDEYISNIVGRNSQMPLFREFLLIDKILRALPDNELAVFLLDDHIVIRTRAQAELEKRGASKE